MLRKTVIALLAVASIGLGHTGSLLLARAPMGLSRQLPVLQLRPMHGHRERYSRLLRDQSPVRLRAPAARRLSGPILSGSEAISHQLGSSDRITDIAPGPRFLRDDIGGRLTHWRWPSRISRSGCRIADDTGEVDAQGIARSDQVRFTLDNGLRGCA